MSVEKKSLISNRTAVKKALIATQGLDTAESNPLRVSSLTAQSMKGKQLSASTFKIAAFKKK